MLDKLKTIEEHYLSLENKLGDPDIIKDQQQWQKLTREHASLQETVKNYREMQQVEQELHEARKMLQEKPEEEMVLFLQEEINTLTSRKEALEEELKALLLPRDPNDDKDVIMELRAGAGGDEAALFAADLLRMYLRFAERKQWKAEILSSHETDIGGYKEISFSIKGQGAYSMLK